MATFNVNVNNAPNNSSTIINPRTLPTNSEGFIFDVNLFDLIDEGHLRPTVLTFRLHGSISLRISLTIDVSQWLTQPSSVALLADHEVRQVSVVQFYRCRHLLPLASEGLIWLWAVFRPFV
jgi:hypothetical protein